MRSSVLNIILEELLLELVGKHHKKLAKRLSKSLENRHNEPVVKKTRKHPKLQLLPGGIEYTPPRKKA